MPGVKASSLRFGAPTGQLPQGAMEHMKPVGAGIAGDEASNHDTAVRSGSNPRIRPQPRLLDGTDRTLLIDIRRIPTDPDRP